MMHTRAATTCVIALMTLAVPAGADPAAAPAAQAGRNLVSNGSFEFGFSNWVPHAGAGIHRSFALVADKPYHGRTCLRRVMRPWPRRVAGVQLVPR